jgi:nicotinate-nucleotide adenylyltransferase
LSRIGILGGTFDPPHYGHLTIAEMAIRKLNLEEVIFVPAKTPPHKSVEEISSRRDRLAMLKLAVAGKERILISEIEFERQGPSYTVDTLTELQREYPDDEFYFLIGADNISEMESWHQPERIFEMVNVVAAGRPGFSGAGKFAGMIESFEMKPVNISSTMIREKVRAGQSISGLLPAAIEEYVLNRNLYKINE